MKVSRRNFLKSVGTGAAVAGLSGYGMSNPPAGSASTRAQAQCPNTICDPQGSYSWFFNQLETCCPGEKLDADEMRITFLGTSCIPRLSQQGVSVYVEVGPTKTVQRSNGTTWQVPKDYAMFDCGMGVLANYVAMGIPYSRMDKIFIAHLHADHMSELSAIYCFGESNDRKSPLYVWGPSPSGLPDPVTGEIYDDGTKGTLTHLREVWRWHTESFSFGSNSYKSFTPPSQAGWHTPVPLVPVGPRYRTNPHGTPLGPRYADPYGKTPVDSGDPIPMYDSYALVPIELDWTKHGEEEGDNIAYWNEDSGLKITHFPAIHTRRGSISYKLEWNGLSMIYSGDTRPNYTMIDQAGGVDVWVHEIVMPPDAWVRKGADLPECAPVPQSNLDYAKQVQDSSHTTQGAFGYMLTQISPRPRLAVATHFQAQDDTIESAQESLDLYGIPRDAYTFAADFMVVNVKPGEIKVRRADVSKYAFCAPSIAPTDPNTPKYHDENGVGNPLAQIDTTDQVPETEDKYGNPTYDPNGYGPPGTPCPCGEGMCAS